MKDAVTRLDYCQYLLASQINYTLTNFADHSESFAHDPVNRYLGGKKVVNRYLGGKKVTPRLVWEHVASDVVETVEGHLVFDDTVLDKRYSFAIELVQRQYSGVIKGIGVVTCVSVNPKLAQFWLLDYRIYDPTGDGKSKLDHVQELLSHTVDHRQLVFQAVLMDTWYATKDLMLFIESLQTVYYCPLKDKRPVDAAGAKRGYHRVEALAWSELELKQGKRLKIKGFPKNHKVQGFRVVVSTHRTAFVVTNDLAQNATPSYTTDVWLPLEN